MSYKLDQSEADGKVHRKCLLAFPSSGLQECSTASLLRAACAAVVSHPQVFAMLSQADSRLGHFPFRSVFAHSWGSSPIFLRLLQQKCISSLSSMRKFDILKRNISHDYSMLFSTLHFASLTPCAAFSPFSSTRILILSKNFRASGLTPAARARPISSRPMSRRGRTALWRSSRSESVSRLPAGPSPREAAKPRKRGKAS